MLITIDTEKSSAEEIRKAVRILIALEDSTDELRSTIKMLYDTLASKVDSERIRYKKLARQHARQSKLRNLSENKANAGSATGCGSFQGIETGF
jgi:hypothetical protein